LRRESSSALRNGFFAHFGNARSELSMWRISKRLWQTETERHVLQN
jgi:hypothetical protein